MGEPRPRYRKVIWGCGNDSGCEAAASVEVYDDKVVIRVTGGCWFSLAGKVVITKDKILVIDDGGMEEVIPTPWSKTAIGVK